MTVSNKLKPTFFRASVVAIAMLVQACQPGQSNYLTGVGGVTEEAAQAAAAQVPQNTRGCGISAVRWLIGQPESTMAAMSISGPVRVIPAGGRVSSDHNPARKNFQLDVGGRISSITCG